MEYREYKVGEGLEKKLGILGETHIYTREETELAEDVVPEYDVIGHEGGRQKAWYLSLIYAVPMRAILAGTRRSLKNKTAKGIAENLEKKTVSLETGYKLSKTSAIYLGSLAILGTILSPLLYIESKLFGRMTEKYYAKKAKKAGKTRRLIESKISRLDRFLAKYVVDQEERDDLMAARSAELLRQEDNLLVVCGEGHLQGLVERLSKDFELEPVTQRKPVINV